MREQDTQKKLSICVKKMTTKCLVCHKENRKDSNTFCSKKCSSFHFNLRSKGMSNNQIQERFVKLNVSCMYCKQPTRRKGEKTCGSLSCVKKLNSIRASIKGSIDNHRTKIRSAEAIIKAIDTSKRTKRILRGAISRASNFNMSKQEFIELQKDVFYLQEQLKKYEATP